MRILINYFLCLLLLLSLVTCKRKTNIKGIAVIAALDEPCRGCKVVLIERKERGFFSSDAQCKEIASTITDNNGECSFDEERLKTNNSCDYFMAVSEAYGQGLATPCGGKTSGFIKPGSAHEQTFDASGLSGTVVVQYNNLLQPSIAGDTLLVTLSTIEYFNPKDASIVKGGGGVYSVFQSNMTGSTPPFGPVYLSNPKQTIAQRLFYFERKRKLGVMTIRVDTVKVYPNQTTTVVVDW